MELAARQHILDAMDEQEDRSKIMDEMKAIVMVIIPINEIE